VINDRLVDAGALPIAVRDFGGEQPPLLLLHGAGGNLATLTTLARALRPRHRVITLDLRGHGRSDKPREESSYEMDLFVADVLAVLDRLEVERADYLGYSLGGRVGFSLADGFGARIGRLVSAAGAPGNEHGAFDRLFFPGCIDVLESAGMPAFLDGWQAHSGAPLDAATKAAFTANDAPALAAYMRRAERDTGVPDSRLATFATPTLMLVGSADAERLAVAEHVAGTAPLATLRVLEGASHADVLRHPQARPAIRAFLT
jgi:pimeloyl-ACP methyl ester carboxylesterase